MTEYRIWISETGLDSHYVNEFLGITGKLGVDGLASVARRLREKPALTYVDFFKDGYIRTGKDPSSFSLEESFREMDSLVSFEGRKKRVKILDKLVARLNSYVDPTNFTEEEFKITIDRIWKIAFGRTHYGDVKKHTWNMREGLTEGLMSPPYNYPQEFLNSKTVEELMSLRRDD